MSKPRHIPPIFTALALALPASSALAIEIQGVQNASLDQPRINAAIRLPGTTTPLSGTSEDIFGNPATTFNIQAFYDTGASGVLVSQETANVLNLPRQQATTGGNVIFEDVGVGGSSAFNVSEEVFIDLAPFTPAADIDNPASYNATYTQSFGPIRTQIGPLGALDNPLLSGLDVFGMPLFQNKSVHMDARPVNNILGTIETQVYNYGDPEPNAIKTQRTVRMTYADFERFTQVDPLGSPAPTLNGNPFVGPDPLAALNGTPIPPDAPAGITIRHNGNASTNSWLFDTGAAASILSEAVASTLGISYDPNAAVPTLLADGVEAPNQFRLSIGGIGGTTQLAGLFLNELIIPVAEGDQANPDDPKHLKFINAPVLVGDITVLDPITQDAVTLEGILGMNYLVGSIAISEPFSIGDVRAGAFDDLVFDHPTAELRLRFNPDVAADFDVNVDGLIDANDIDELYAQLGSTDFLDFADLNNDSSVTQADIDLLLTTQLNSLPGDANLDGTVDLIDLSLLATNFGTTAGWAAGSFNGVNEVDLIDLSTLATHFGQSATIPEPTAATLLGLATLMTLRRTQ
ncbi:aspartyl protease family protein [Mucisphaera sp.]|uniref:aspartyl protease family protein n=1 Tax=Mucisphaera sp. TaxID=2913024 RepID=UPI003D0C0E18